MKCEACEHENVDGARFCAGCGALLPTKHEGKDPLIGQVIGGRYRITGIIGEGGMGIVYEAEQPMGSTIRKVAVKTLHAHLSQDPAVLARFHRECGTVAQLEHANTIKFYDFGAMADGTLYIAMEYVKGQPLSSAIEKGALAPERVVQIMRQIAGALDEAHQLGIIHRDLKPENVILTERAGEKDFVKVLDFGIAARTESADAQKEAKLTQQGMVLGTPPYMSPEQFTGKPLDSRSDIYSLGVMAYEMLVGRLPFEADTPWQWATQHMTAQPLPFEATPVAAAIPAAMRAAIMRALSKDPKQRQDTAKKFFDEIASGQSVAAGPSSVSTGQSPASAGTAAMAVVPDFGGSAPAMAPMAAHAPAPMAAPMHPVGTGPAVSANIPPPGRHQQAQGGGKGLIFALAGIAGVILIAIVIVAARSLKPEQDEALTNPLTSANPTATIAPVDTGETTQTTGTGTETPTGTGGTSAGTTTTTGTGKTGTTKPTPSGSSGTTTPVTTGSGKPPVGTTDPAACAACIAAAQGGNISGAAAQYNKCSDAGQKARCQALAKSQAPGQARTAAFNGQCPRAKSIAGSARSMGADSPALGSAIASCK